MSNTQPLLTIAIPTYNRAGCLRQLLTHLAPQLKRVSGVELIISDNASSDSTPEVVESFQRQGLLVTYLRNQKNLGMDGNFLQCFEKASGKYVWLIGDDDVLVPDGLDTVLPLLSSNDYDLVYVTSYSFEGDFSPRIRPVSSPPEIFQTALPFVRKVHVGLTFLSGNIIHRNRVLALDHPPFSDLEGTKLAQLGWTYTLLRHFKASLLIRDPLIAARADNTGGYPVFYVFGVSLRRITESWLIDRALVRVMLRSTIHFFFPWFLLKMKSMDHTFETEDPHVVLRSAFRDQYQYWLFNYPIIRLPRPFAKGWYFFGRVLVKLDGYFGSYIFG